MKRIFLFTALVSLSIASVFSQVNKSTKLDSISPNLSVFKITKPIIQSDPFDFTSIFNRTKSDNKQVLLNISESKFDHITQFSSICEKFNSGDHIPCIKPEGYFSMRIYKPNANAKYALLNK